MSTLFGESPELPPQIEEYKAPRITPFDFINAITHGKNNLMVDDWSERQYEAWMVNRGLSFGSDTVIQANEMNSRPHLDRKLQFDFLINIVRPKKRFNKWIKAEKTEAIDIIKEYYEYSNRQARQVVSLFDDHQLELLKQKLQKGGRNAR